MGWKKQRDSIGIDGGWAANVWEAGNPLVIKEVEVAPP